MQELKFDPETHIYTIKGRQLPSVTTVIGQFVKVGNQYVNIFTGATIMADIFEAAGDWGRAVHNMIALWLENDLEELALTPALTDTLEQFHKWTDEYKPEIVSHEKRLFSKKYYYAGCYDLKCIIGKKLYIVDYKTGAYSFAGPQLAAYVQLYKEESKYRGRVKRYVLHLPKNGKKFKFVRMDNPHDFDFFLCRLREWQYLNKK